MEQSRTRVLLGVGLLIIGLLLFSRSFVTTTTGPIIYMQPAVSKVSISSSPWSRTVVERHELQPPHWVPYHHTDPSPFPFFVVWGLWFAPMLLLTALLLLIWYRGRARKTERYL